MMSIMTARKSQQKHQKNHSEVFVIDKSNSEIRKAIEEGCALYENKKLDAAKAVFQSIIDREEKCTEAYYYLGNILHAQGELGRAIRCFNKVLELEPQHTDASLCLSVILNDIGRYEEAQAVYNKADQQVGVESGGVDDLHINKKFALKHYDLAEQYAAYHRYDEAVFEYDKAIGLDPSNIEMKIKLAQAYAKKGYMDRSIEELQKAKKENPYEASLRMALGLTYFGMGKVIEAQSEWQEVLQQDPTHPEARMYMDLSQASNETRL